VPGLSIIIPAGDDVSRFEDTLAAVLRNRPRACEVIVPHAGTYADPYELASEVWFIELPPSSTYAECLASAVDKASAEVIHILSPGCEFEENWWQPALHAFDDASVGSVSPLVLTNDDNRGALGVTYGLRGRSEVFSRGLARVLGPTHRAGFYRRSALKQIGGWPTTLAPALADVDVALSLRQLGYRTVHEGESRIHCPGATPALPSYQRSRQQEQLHWRHVAGFAWATALAIHPLAAAADCLLAGGPGAMLSAVAGKFASLGDIRECCTFAARLHGLKRLTVTNPPPKTSGHPQRGEDQPRRAA
jgi:hypothetical protein